MSIMLVAVVSLTAPHEGKLFSFYIHCWESKPQMQSFLQGFGKKRWRIQNNGHTAEVERVDHGKDEVFCHFGVKYDIILAEYVCKTMLMSI